MRLGSSAPSASDAKGPSSNVAAASARTAAWQYSHRRRPLAADIGMACGAGLLPLATFATLLHFVTILVVAPLVRLMPQSRDRSSITVTYEDGRVALRGVLARAATLGCQTTLINTHQETLDGVKVVRARLRFRFGSPLGDIMAQVSELPGVVGVDLSPRAADDL